ncbi:MAG: malate dehydrogenase [Rubritepida sp.]|nr:malate dehydrogenase [Rubritepida sp.]
MAEPDYVYIPVQELESFVTRIFGASGCTPVESARIANHLVGANLAGHDSHGVDRVPRYIAWQKAGYIIPDQKIEVISDGGGFALLDGKFGFGQTVAKQATEFGIARALQSGACIVGLRNSGHIGRTGDYAEMATAQGLISIHFVNVAGSVLVAPFGGKERRFSTAPFCIGVPLPSGPVILDFATSFVAEGKVLVASNGGKALPENALITQDGEMSGDPHTLYGPYEQVGPRNASGGTGAIRAFGDHKGSGLALMCELLAGALTGGGTSGPITERGRIANGMLSIYLSPQHFGDEDAFHQAATDYIAWVKSCRPAAEDAPILAPGEPENHRRAARRVSGVPLTKDAWQGILETAASLGINGP